MTFLGMVFLIVLEETNFRLRHDLLGQAKLKNIIDHLYTFLYRELN